MGALVPTAYRRRSGLAHLRWVFVIAILMAWFIKSVSEGGDGPVQGEKPVDSEHSQGQFFVRTRVNFWRYPRSPTSSRVLSEQTEPKVLADPTEFWREGTFVPSKPVLNLLENPTIENAHQYLIWQKEKIAKILAAQEAITAAQRSPQGDASQQCSPGNTPVETKVNTISPPGNGTSSKSIKFQDFREQTSKPLRITDPRPDNPWSKLLLTYYYYRSCPACAEQDRNLEILSQRYPRISITAVDLSRHPETALAGGIRATPTIFLRFKNYIGFRVIEGVCTPERIIEEARRFSEQLRVPNVD